MNPNKALWEKGDFTRIAASMRESGEALVRDIGVKSGLKVLDLGCGDGTTALPSAKLGADVLGVDIASNLVEAGNRRAQLSMDSANLKFQEGDASCFERSRGPILRSRRQHVRRHVRAKAPRCGQRNGARDETGRPHRHGQLDSGRPDFGGADLEDQFVVCAAAAGRLHQSGDVGH